MEAQKIRDNKAWFLVLPVILTVAFTAIIPLMTVVNYSVQDVLTPTIRPFVGLDWFREVAQSSSVRNALRRNLLFSLQVIAIQIPLGVAIALIMPKKGWRASAALVIVATPLLIPWNVVGTIWQIFARSDIGLGGYVINQFMSYNYALQPGSAWVTVLVMDVWHWTPLVVLLAYAGLRAIPEPFYRAAEIDGASAWSTFRYVQLPKLRGVLMIALLLRFMDSFMIFAEPFVLTGGGPGNTTNFLSILLTRIAIGEFDLGPAGAFSLMYFLLIQILCFTFFTVLTRQGRA